jgi:hypothetical protein
MAKSDSKKIGGFLIFALLLVGVLGYLYYANRALVSVTKAGVDVGKAGLMAGAFA